MHKSAHYRAPLVLEALRELANMRDDGEKRFLRYIETKFGRQVYGDPNCYFNLHCYFPPYDTKGQPDNYDIDETTLTRPFEKFTFIRDNVRQMWRGGEEAENLVNGVLFSEAAKHDYSSEQMPFLPRSLYAAVHMDWKRRELRFNPLDQFQAGVYELARHSHLAKVCARPDCPTPYFIAKRIIQQYCSLDCAEWAKRETQREYWGQKGSDRRRQRKASGRRKGKR